MSAAAQKNTSVKETIKDGWNGLDGTTKIIIIVLIIILVIVLYGKVTAALEERKLAKYANRSPIDGGQFRDPRSLIDNIYDKLYGTNWLYVYPEVVNKIANLSEAEIDAAEDYWEQRYANETGYPTLYEFINAEWDGGEYEPALQILRQYGHA